MAAEAHRLRLRRTVGMRPQSAYLVGVVCEKSYVGIVGDGSPIRSDPARQENLGSQC
jgi:hypothetical protein